MLLLLLSYILHKYSYVNYGNSKLNSWFHMSNEGVKVKVTNSNKLYFTQSIA